MPHLDEQFDRLVGTWLGEADAFLFGRRTYQNCAGLAEDDRPSIRRHLERPAEVRGPHGLTKAEWNPTTILFRDIPVQVAELKAARPGTADPRQRPVGSVPPGRRADRHVAARDRPGRGGPGRRLFPGRRRTGRPAARQPSDDTRRPVGAHLRNDGVLESSGPTRPTRRHLVPDRHRRKSSPPVELPHLDCRSLMIPYTFRWSRVDSTRNSQDPLIGVSRGLSVTSHFLAPSSSLPFEPRAGSDQRD